MSGARPLYVGVTAVALLVAAACSSIRERMPKQVEAHEKVQRIQELQLRVMRFADEYAGRTKEVITQFQAGARNPEERLNAQNWKVQQADAAYTVASGPNPVSNALDMVVLATLSRMVLDDIWEKQLYGERARPVQETYKSLESGAWSLIADVLSAEQSTRLRQIIEQWRAEHPTVRSVSYIHFRDFAKSVGAPSAEDERNSGGLFSLIGLDPLKQLDPAVREIAQTRELAERSIYYIQRAPGLVDMQIERLTYQIAAMQETQKLLTNTDRISLIGSASDQLVQTLPDLLAREREALFAQVTKLLTDQNGKISALSSDLRSTLVAGADTAKELQVVLATLKSITDQFQPKPDATGKRPFDIRDYTEMLQQLADSSRELNTLAQRIDGAVPTVKLIAQDAKVQANEFLNRAFMLLMILVVVTIALTLGAALVYRAVVAKQHRATNG